MSGTLSGLDSTTRALATTLVACLVALLEPVQPLAADSSQVEGRKLYLRYCSSCHGEDATGNGPVASELKTPPPDLTRIRERHGDMWPYLRLRDIIDGRGRRARAHGPREMPVWGDLIGSEGGDAPGRELKVSNQITRAARLPEVDPAARAQKPSLRPSEASAGRHLRELRKPVADLEPRRLRLDIDVGLRSQPGVVVERSGGDHDQRLAGMRRAARARRRFRRTSCRRTRCRGSCGSAKGGSASPAERDPRTRSVSTGSSRWSWRLLMVCTSMLRSVS